MIEEVASVVPIEDIISLYVGAKDIVSLSVGAEDVLSLSVGAEDVVSLSGKVHSAARTFLMFVLVFMFIFDSSAAFSFATVIALANDPFSSSEQVTKVMT